MENNSKSKQYKFLSVNMMYLTCALLFLSVGYVFQDMNIELGLIVTEYILILLPVILLGLFTKVDLKKALRLKKLKGKHVLLTIGMAVTLIPVIFTSNFIMIVILNSFDKMTVQSIPNATNGPQLILYLFIISLSAGLCEEFFFRGMVLNAYENHFNKKTAVVLSAILFGVFHYNLQNLAGPIILGLFFGYLVIVTESIWAGVIAHATNNGVAVIGGYIAQNFSAEPVDAAAATDATAAAMETLKFPAVLPALIAILIFAGICLFLAYRIARLIGKDFIKYNVDDEISIDNQKFRIIEIEDDNLKLLSEKHYEYDEQELVMKKITKKSLKKYTISIVASPNEVIDIIDKPTMEITIYKMIPIIISFLIYIVLWVRYLGSV